MNRRLPERVKNWYKTKSNNQNLQSSTPSNQKTRADTKRDIAQNISLLKHHDFKMKPKSSSHPIKKNSKVTLKPNTQVLSSRKAEKQQKHTLIIANDQLISLSATNNTKSTANIVQIPVESKSRHYMYYNLVDY